MQEKILVEGRLGNAVKKIRNIIWFIGMIPGGIMGVYTIFTFIDCVERANRHGGYWEEWMISTITTYVIITFIFLIIPFIVGIVIYSGLSKIQIVVTDKRVYGKAMHGKQVDLPLDSISTLGMGAFSSIAVATSSGKITFWGISNRDEVHKAISGLLQSRQSGNKQEATVTHVTQQAQSSADELMKYKELLDNGIITQEEFDAKKKQLLGL